MQNGPRPGERAVVIDWAAGQGDQPRHQLRDVIALTSTLGT
jgi:hypothetical protein